MNLRHVSTLALVAVSSLASLASATAPEWKSIGPAGHAGYKLFTTTDPNILYLTVGTSAGLFRTEDQGQHWRQVNSRYFSTLAVDPRDPDRLVGCTCEGSDFYAFDIVRSDDGGRTLRSARQGLLYQGSIPDVLQFVFDLRDPDVVYGASEFGLYRAEGDGPWTPLAFAGLQVRALAIDPRAPRSFTAAVVDPGPNSQGPIVATTQRSRDAGSTWTGIPDGTIHPLEIAQLFFDPVRAHRLYASANCQPFRLSADGWVRLGPADLPFMCTLAADPNGKLFGSSFAPGRLQRSDDGGEHWVLQPGPPSDFALRLVVPPGAPNTVLLTGSRGVWRSLDSGLTWRPASTGLSGFVIADMAVAGDIDGTLYTSPGNEGVFRSRDHGGQWKRIVSGLNDDSFGNPVLAVDPRNPEILWAGGRQLHQSRDGGDHWLGVSLPGSDEGRSIVKILLDPVRDGFMYVTTYAPIGPDTVGPFTFRSADGGHSWQPLPRFTSTAAVLALAPSDGALYVFSNSGELFRSLDGGSSWRRITQAAVPPSLTSLSVDPTRSGVLWAGTYESGVWRSLDGGRSFTEVVGGAPVYYEPRFAFDPSDPQHPYAAGGGDGVVRWSGPARGWVVVGAPNAYVQGTANGPLALDVAQGWLYVGTSQHGIFRLSLGDR